mmetsp:Transcript_6477/g.8764  ORF Transcript_6477/g.8764 Transcript_6477/m.8764 type:complete len:116 (-) Transcript_6477:1821-2168(-)
MGRLALSIATCNRIDDQCVIINEPPHLHNIINFPFNISTLECMLKYQANTCTSIYPIISGLSFFNTGNTRVGCASVLNTCLFKMSTSVSGSNNKYRYLSVSAKKKLSILSSTEPG